jgi:hypothetical protein
MSVSSTISLLAGNAISACIGQNIFQGVILAMLIMGSLLLMTTGFNTFNSVVVATCVFILFALSYLYLRFVNSDPQSVKGEYEAIEMQEQEETSSPVQENGFAADTIVDEEEEPRQIIVMNDTTKDMEANEYNL